MEVVNMQELAEELQKEGVGILDQDKYQTIIRALMQIWEENSRSNDTSKFTRINAKKLMVKLYDHYNKNEIENDRLTTGEVREMLKKTAYNILKNM